MRNIIFVLLFLSASSVEAGITAFTGVSEIADGSVTSVKLADDAVTSEKISAGAVTSDKISAGAVTTNKLSFDTATQSELDTHEGISDAHHTPTIDTFVTGTDSHDHVGGDGSQIDHDGLSNVSTSDHHTKTTTLSHSALSGVGTSDHHAQTTTLAHSALSGVSASQHHAATINTDASTKCSGTDLLNGSDICVGAGGGHGDGTNAPSGKFTLGVDANGNSQNGTVDASAVDSSTNPVQSNALFDHNALTGDGAHGATKSASAEELVVREADASINVSSIQMNSAGLVDFGRIYYDVTGIRKDQSVTGATKDLNLEAPRTNSGQGSSINIVAATAEAGGFGGDIHLSAGAGNSNRGGEITLLGGVTSNCANTVSGDINLTGGANESTTATGAQVLVKGAITDGDCTADAAGGDLTLKGGNADALIGGDVFIDGGTGSTQGDIIIGTVNTLTDVGIGIVTPAEKLDVSGNIQLTGNLLVGGTVDGVDVAVHAADASAHHPQTTTLAHSALSGVGSSDHHSKTVSSEIDHDSITGVSADDHHAQSHTVASHSDTTATGAELETLTDGSNADSLHAHSGGGSSVLSAIKSVDEVETTSTLQNDDHLFLSLSADTSYYVKLTVSFTQAGNQGDPKFGFTFPATWTIAMPYHGSEDGGYAAGRITASGDNGDFFGANNGATHLIFFDGIVNTAGSSGTLQFQFSMNGGGTNVTALAKSYIRAEAF